MKFFNLKKFEEKFKKLKNKPQYTIKVDEKALNNKLESYKTEIKSKETERVRFAF